MSEANSGAVLSKIVELSEIDVVVAGLQAQLRRFENEESAKAVEIKNYDSARKSRLITLEAKAALVAREEAAVKLERDRVNERRRALTGQTDYKVQQAMEREIDFVSKQIGQREDVLLGVMREVEQLEQEVRGLEAASQKGAAELAALKESSSGEIKAINQRLGEYAEHRQALVISIGAGHAGMTLYNRARARYPQDPVVAIINRNTCGGCHMTLGPQVPVQVVRGEVIKCPGCTRILKLDAEQVAA